MTGKEKNWYSVKSGYFIRLSNEDTTPAALLDEYFGRTRIETVFKTAKEYLQLLPLSKWTIDTVSGKLLSDCISTIIYLMMQKKLDGSKISMTRLLGQTQSLMCMKTRDGVIRVETANKQGRAVFKALEYRSLLISGWMITARIPCRLSLALMYVSVSESHNIDVLLLST